MVSARRYYEPTTHTVLGALFARGCGRPDWLSQFRPIYSGRVGPTAWRSGIAHSRIRSVETLGTYEIVVRLLEIRLTSNFQIRSVLILGGTAGQ